MENNYFFTEDNYFTEETLGGVGQMWTRGVPVEAEA